MSAEFFLLLVVVIAGFFFLYWVINKRLNQNTSGDLVEWLKTTSSRMDAQSQSLNERLDRAANVISGVQRSVGEMSEIGRSMKDLQELLRSPKLRGNIG